MPFILMIGSFPQHEATEVGNTFLKLPKLPDFVRTIYVFLSAEGKTTFYSLYEVPDDKYFEGIKAIIKRYTGYREIEGYEYKLIPLLESKDALAMIGLA